MIEYITLFHKGSNQEAQQIQQNVLICWWIVDKPNHMKNKLDALNLYKYPKNHLCISSILDKNTLLTKYNSSTLQAHS